MKKILALLLALVMVFALAACGQQAAPAEEPAAPAEEPAAETPVEEAPAEEPAEAPAEEAPVEVMSYADFMAAEVDDPVVIEAYVQAKQALSNGAVSIYAQNEDGGVFIYAADCDEDTYDKLEEGVKIRVTGYKTEWSGEVEIASGSTFEIEDGQFIATPVDVTSLLGSDSLIDHQNEVVSFKDMTVADKGDGRAFYYNWDNSGTEGDDLYFDASLNGKKYTFTVESYLTDSNSEVYNAVENLKVGDVIDVEGFLYWYEGMNPHITSVTVK
jgi:predicted small lipoprotein YifL